MAIEEKVIEQTQETTTPVVTSPTPPVNDLSEQLKQINCSSHKISIPTLVY